MSASETQVVQKDSLNWANKISCPQLATRFVRRMRGRRGAVVGVPLTATNFSYSTGGEGGASVLFYFNRRPFDRIFFHAAVSQFETNEQRKVLQSKKYWMAASLSLLFELQWVCQDSQSNFCWTGPKVRGQCGENDLRNNQAALKKVSKKKLLFRRSMR